MAELPDFPLAAPLTAASGRSPANSDALAGGRGAAQRPAASRVRTRYGLSTLSFYPSASENVHGETWKAPVDRRLAAQSVCWRRRALCEPSGCSQDAAEFAAEFGPWLTHVRWLQSSGITYDKRGTHGVYAREEIYFCAVEGGLPAADCGGFGKLLGAPCYYVYH